MRILKKIFNFSAEAVTNTLSNSMKEAEERKQRDQKNTRDSHKAKKSIEKLWKDSLNARKQAFWTYYKAKTTAETFEKLLEEDPPKMPRRFLPKGIPNEEEEETKIRQEISLENFKAEIRLLHVRAKSYEQKFTKIDVQMVENFTEKYTENVVDHLKEFWFQDCKKEEEFSMNKFRVKENFFLNNTESGLKWKTDDKKKISSRKDIKEKNHNQFTNRKVQFGHENSKNLKVTRKISQLPEEITRERAERFPKRRPYRTNGGQRNGRQYNQPIKSALIDKFEVGILDKLRRSRSLPSIPSNITIIPETQEEVYAAAEEENDNFLFHGQGARVQDHNL